MSFVHRASEYVPAQQEISVNWRVCSTSYHCDELAIVARLMHISFFCCKALSFDGKCVLWEGAYFECAFHFTKP